MADKVGKGIVPIEPGTDGFGAALEKGLDAEGGPAAKRSADKMQKVMAGVFAGGAALLGKSVMDFGGFEKGMNEVFTLMPGITGDAMGKMTEQVKDFSTEFGVLPTEAVPALYEALGAGVPPDNIFEFLETAQKLAKGGVTDLATSVDGLSSVTNAYGTDVISAAEASDVMFKIVGLGKGTLDDVAGSLFNVTPIASALGVSFQDVGAAMAVLSSKGTPVSVATTQIRGMISELGKDGTKVADIFEGIAGKSFPEFIEGGGTLAEALKVVQTGADEAGLSVLDVFGSVEAGSAALALLDGDAKAFTDATVAMGDAAGSTDAAYAQMNQGLSNTIDALKAKFAVTLLDIGEQIAPTVKSIGEGIGLVLELFSSIPGPIQAIVVVFGTLAAGAFAFAGPILKGITLFSKLGGVLTALSANPWMLAALALAAVALLIVKHWDKVKAVIGGAIDWIAGKMEMFGKLWAPLTEGDWYGVGEVVDNLFGNTGKLVKPITDGLTAIEGFVFRMRDAFVSGWNAIWSTVTTVSSAITTTVQTFVDTTVGIVTGAWSTLQAVTSTAFGAMSTTISTIGGGVVAFVTGIPGAITGAFSTLASVISAPFVSAFGAIKASWNATVGGFGFTTPGWIPGFGGRDFRIPNMATGGILTEPTLFRGGEYPGARRNPEIVAPQRIMRQTVMEAIASTLLLDRGGSGGGLTVNGPLIGNVERMSGEDDALKLSRVLARQMEREQRGAGKRLGGVAQP